MATEKKKEEGEGSQTTAKKPGEVVVPAQPDEATRERGREVLARLGFKVRGVFPRKDNAGS